ncbi:hypothetical protein JKP88DRAFT_225612 [Tribonema minus]|uniref:Uncharacterized protein n=1 Tax=Tribonema minus TaxID=303371 RepID=A0A835YMW3_9STRA|nr:hypothetical protein JKP88DRAFT_225612 [Tribonema minus]
MWTTIGTSMPCQLFRSRCLSVTLKSLLVQVLTGAFVSFSFSACTHRGPCHTATCLEMYAASCRELEVLRHTAARTFITRIGSTQQCLHCLGLLGDAASSSS